MGVRVNFMHFIVLSAWSLMKAILKQGLPIRVSPPVYICGLVVRQQTKE